MPLHLSLGYCQYLQALKQQEEVLAKEVEELKEKLKVLEHLARGRGLLSIFGVTQGQETQSSKAMSVAWGFELSFKLFWYIYIFGAPLTFL